MKITKGRLYTWESNNIPVYVLNKGKAMDMVSVLTWDSEIHFIDEGNLIKLTVSHKNLDWCKQLSNN